MNLIIAQFAVSGGNTGQMSCQARPSENFLDSDRHNFRMFEQQNHLCRMVQQG